MTEESNATKIARQLPPFETIRQEDENGNDFWSARDLYKFTQYKSWRNFKNVINKAKIACKNAEQDIEDHFENKIKLLKNSKGINYKVEDFKLSRFACYLIMENADSAKTFEGPSAIYYAGIRDSEEKA